MISAIGIMIGFYILSRMISFLTRNGDRKETNGAKIFFVITILITCLMILSLIITTPIK